MIENRHKITFLSSFLAKQLSERYGTPLYIYDLDTISNNYYSITQSISYKPTLLYFACMANNNISLLKELRVLGLGVFVCTYGELALAQFANFRPSEITVTGSNYSDSEFKMLAQSEATLNVDSLQQIEAFAKFAKVNKIGIRLSPNINIPNDIINSAVGPLSRLGFTKSGFKKAVSLAKQNKLIINGLHMYIGTNILDYTYFIKALEQLVSISEELDCLEYINIGGGFGIPNRDVENSFDWIEFGKVLSQILEDLSTKKGCRIKLSLEPGRSILGSAGILLCSVTEVKHKNGCTFVGTDASMSTFPRPYIYNQNHDVVLISDEKKTNTESNIFICGNTVASSDFLSKNISFPAVEKNDMIAIMNTGAYGFSMSSHFCCRLKPAEVMLKGGNVHLIRERETAEDLFKRQAIGKC